MKKQLTLTFENRYAKLPEYFYTKMPAEGFAKDPWVIHANLQGLELIGLDKSAIKNKDFPAYFSGNKKLEGSDPLAMVYSGHQFGQWAGQLGDGRALLLGQVRGADDKLWDIQLKGGGKTPYSRFGDGRAVLRSCIREYLCSEAMHGLSIPTTRSLCMIGTGEPVFRETAEPGAIFTRLAQSHIRFGHFEHFYYRKQSGDVKLLSDHVIAEYFPDIAKSDNRYELWFQQIVKRTAMLIANWQALGFCHGVMNTDNISILGLTLDYGPFGFMEDFDPAFICNHSDHSGRYAYDQQPSIGLWNLHALAHALQPVLPWEKAVDIMAGYDATLTQTYQQLMCAKIGLDVSDENNAMWLDLVRLMIADKSDYTLTFRYLADTFGNPDKWLALFIDKNAAGLWLKNYHKHVAASAELISRLNATNPKFVLRNWVAEVAIRAAEDKNDYTMLDDLLDILHKPYDEHPDFNQFAAPAPETYKNLCVSCSS